MACLSRYKRPGISHRYYYYVIEHAVNRDGEFDEPEKVARLSGDGPVEGLT